MNKDKIIVVTGGAGFIGSGVIRHLNNEGFKKIVIVDDLGSTEKWKNLVGKSFIQIIGIQDCFQWLKGKEKEIQAFIHLGACTNTLETDASYLLENNFRYSVRLAEYAMQHGHRFIYASSAATYGNGDQGFVDDHGQLESLHPINMYGYSKHLFDLWLKEHGLLERVVGLKYFNVYGPNELHKGRMASAIIKMLQTVLKEGKISLFRSSDPQYEDGGQMRDFIYIKDVARMTCSFLQNAICGIFNIGTGRASTWNELASAVFKALEKPVQIEYIPMPADIIGYQNYTCAEMSKAKQALKGVVACPSLEETVVEYVRDYLVPKKSW